MANYLEQLIKNALKDTRDRLESIDKGIDETDPSYIKARIIMLTKLASAKGARDAFLAVQRAVNSEVRNIQTFSSNISQSDFREELRRIIQEGPQPTREYLN